MKGSEIKIVIRNKKKFTVLIWKYFGYGFSIHERPLPTLRSSVKALMIELPRFRYNIVRFRFNLAILKHNLLKYESFN